MSKYINVVIAAEKISEKHNISLSELVDTFAEMPSADVVEVKRGNGLDMSRMERYLLIMNVLYALLIQPEELEVITAQIAGKQ